MKWDMLPYGVQLIGGIVTASGQGCRNGDGEGKDASRRRPLVSQTRWGSRRDSLRAKQLHGAAANRSGGYLFKGLGLSVGARRHAAATPERRDGPCPVDIPYVTNNEFGLDYIRDHMVGSLDHRVPRGHVTRASDAVDSILIEHEAAHAHDHLRVGARSRMKVPLYNDQGRLQLGRKRPRSPTTWIAEGAAAREPKRI